MIVEFTPNQRFQRTPLASLGVPSAAARPRRR